MAEPAVRSIAHYFQDLDDPRLERSQCHRLDDIVVIALCAVICGADTWVAVEKFGHAKFAWLSQRLELPNGIPSHDTFGRVFRLLCPAKFQDCFLAWIGAVADATDGRLIPIDVSVRWSTGPNRQLWRTRRCRGNGFPVEMPRAGRNAHDRPQRVLRVSGGRCCRALLRYELLRFNRSLPAAP